MSASAFDTLIQSFQPLGYWKLNETTGTIATDSSGNGRHGNWEGVPNHAVHRFLGEPAPGFYEGGPFVSLPAMDFPGASGVSVVALVAGRASRQASRYVFGASPKGENDPGWWSLWTPPQAGEPSTWTGLYNLSAGASADIVSASGSVAFVGEGSCGLIVGVSTRARQSISVAGAAFVVANVQSGRDGIRSIVRIGNIPQTSFAAPRRWVGSIARLAIIPRELTQTDVDALNLALQRGTQAAALSALQSIPVIQALQYQGLASCSGIGAARADGSAGRGSIAGTLLADGQPIARQLRLIDPHSGRVVAAVWPNAQGRYVFTGLALGRPFTVIAHDTAHQYNAVVADHIFAKELP